MERKELIDEIVNFCFEYKVFKNEVKECDIKANIKERLDDVTFIENLTNIIFVKAKKRKKLGNLQILNLLIGLEKIRLDLEAKDVV